MTTSNTPSKSDNLKIRQSDNQKSDNPKIRQSDNSYTGRLAPSPTGALHLGNVRTFMVAYLRARSLGGRLVFRMEDLDHPRDKPGAAQAAIDDLHWLGFEWDEEFTQSKRRAFYRDCLEKLLRQNLVYPCICTRRDVEAAQSAPHPGEQLFYPGICRNRFASWRDAALAAAPRIPCWRFKTPESSVVTIHDAIFGDFTQNVAAELGDFPLARDPDGAGYTLAAVADDMAMGVTEVVRGADLLPATPAQTLVRRALDGGAVAHCHVPIVTGPDGRRLAKRHGDTRISSYRAAGIAPEAIIGRLAQTCGWGDGSPATLQSLLPLFSLDSIPRKPVVASAWFHGNGSE